MDLKWISGYVSIKEPRSPALWWHQDWWCWDHPVSYQKRPPQIAVLCYLTDTNVNNGALRVLPGSHLKSVPIHAFLPEAHSHHAGDLEPGHVSMIDLPNQVNLPLSAGDAVVIDYRLLHGTHGNASAMRRECVLLSFTPCWSGLPEDIKAHLIAHPAQPSDRERLQPSSMLAKLIPIFVGGRQDLPINRNAPSAFDILDRGSNRPSLR
jgi:ectoine hydroxylase-related dioxygenase (phytanoyl-CoA dioxygenase family)